MKIIIMTSIIFTFLISSCSDQIKIEDAGFEKSFKIAKKKFHNEDYFEAVNDLNNIILNYGGYNGIDSAQYYLAASHYELNEYYSASFEYIRLTESFPESELVEESFFRSAECYYQLSPPYSLDQKETGTAITKFQMYLDLYPSGEFVKNAAERISELREKLAKKQFTAGLLYMNMDQPRAAKIYFKDVLDNYYDTSFYILSLEQFAFASKAMNDEYNYEIYIKKYESISDEN